MVGGRTVGAGAVGSGAMGERAATCWTMGGRFRQLALGGLTTAGRTLGRLKIGGGTSAFPAWAAATSPSP